MAAVVRSTSPVSKEIPALNTKHHYPPELFELLVETISCLFKSKQAVLTFFWGAGVGASVTADVQAQLKNNRASIYKTQIVRTVLLRLNEAGDTAIRERREIVKRVCEYDDFSTCWPDDQHKAKGLVAEIQSTVGKHDFFRRMQQQNEMNLRRHRESERRESEKLRRHREESRSILRAINGLIVSESPQNRGNQFEKVMNRLFAANGILIRESFVLVEGSGHGISEQIDGVIELDGHIYLVEMKWLKESVGIVDVSRHISRVITRGECRGLFISYSGYTKPAIATCKEAMKDAPIVLCTLREFVMLIENEASVEDFLRTKIRRLIIDKQPFTEML